MPETAKSYATDEIEVTYDPAICIHAAECLRGLPGVFKLRRRPWIKPELATPDVIVDVIARRPSAALTYRRLDQA